MGQKALQVDIAPSDGPPVPFASGGFTVRNWSLRTRVFAGFVAVIGMLAVASAASLSKLSSLRDAESTITDQEAPYINALQEGAIGVRDASSASTVLLIIMISETLQGIIDGMVADAQAGFDPLAADLLAADPSVLARLVANPDVVAQLMGDDADASLTGALAGVGTGVDVTAAMTGDLEQAALLVQNTSVVRAFAANPVIAEALKADPAAQAALAANPPAAQPTELVEDASQAETDASFADYTQRYADGLAAAQAAFVEARAAIAGQTEREAQVDGIQEAVASWGTTMQQLQTGYETNGQFSQDIIDELGVKEAAYKALIADAITVADGSFAAADATFDDAASSAKTVLLVGLLVAMATAIAAGIVVVRSVTKPLGRTVDVLEQVAHGDLTVTVGVRGRDEIARMGEALNVAVGQVHDTLVAVTENALELASASEELSATSRQMASGATETSAQTEEVTATIGEIARRTSEASSIAGEAVQLALNTSTTMQKLEASSEAIGAVVSLISSVAEQTNLLALNATIEAARAGDAGRGFAVVASEVKELANQTAKATQEISEQIRAIQGDSRDAVVAIEQITETIGSISDVASAVAAAVEEQAVTMSEIGRTVEEGAVGAASTEQAASALAEMAAELQRLLAGFTFQTGRAGRSVPSSNSSSPIDAPATSAVSFDWPAPTSEPVDLATTSH
jgi:methyl-accepting chemotaxis protein